MMDFAKLFLTGISAARVQLFVNRSPFSGCSPKTHGNREKMSGRLSGGRGIIHEAFKSKKLPDP